MQILPDTRRIRINMINMHNGNIVSAHAGDAWQNEDGVVEVSGLWAELVPLVQEDHGLMAKSAGISSLEWLYRRLLVCPLISLEIFD